MKINWKFFNLKCNLTDASQMSSNKHKDSSIKGKWGFDQVCTTPVYHIHMGARGGSEGRFAMRERLVLFSQYEHCKLFNNYYIPLDNRHYIKFIWSAFFICSLIDSLLLTLLSLPIS